MEEFMKCKRDAKLFSEDRRLMNWRLASVDEVRDKIGKIKDLGILNSWETVRLLDGCVEKYKVYKQYRQNMENMILVKTKRERPEDGSFDPEMYAEVSLFQKGGNAALLLACEDKITEAICFVLSRMVSKEGDADISQKSPKKAMSPGNSSQGDLGAALKGTLKDGFDDGRKLLQIAIAQAHNNKHPVEIASFLMLIFKDEKELLTGGDVNGRTLLHFAALDGNLELCKHLVEEWRMRAVEKDINKEDVLHTAVKGNNEAVVDYLCQLDQAQGIIVSEDAQRRTALHKAAAQGGEAMINTLLSKIITTDEKERYIRKADIFGQTALLEAARGGHLEAVRLLLNSGSRPLHERNSDGRTALHYAVQLSNDDKAEKMAKLVLNHRRPGDERYYEQERSLLLWASSTGTGTAEEYLRTKREKQRRPNPGVLENYLRTEMDIPGQTPDQDLLSSAIDLGHEMMALELVNRGAPTSQIKNRSWRGQAKLRAENLKKHICNLDRIPDIGRDQPALYDTLERKEFAQGLAALFLNPYVKAPLTVGIFGDWGMGKSSLMIQMESILLQTASQLAFPNLLQREQFPGCGEIQLSQKGNEIYENVNKALKNSDQSSRSKDDPLLEFLDGEYQEKYYKVYKSLALIDRSEMMDAKDEDGEADSRSSKSALTRIPSIVTVCYNAWRYQDESQAWAGLAVEITKEFEESMTTAQRVRCHCRYAWAKNRDKIWLELILPCLFAIFLSGWIAWVIWKLISRSKNSDLVQLTYGSIPITILVAVWTIMNQFLSVIKPISSQVMGYFSKTDHSAKLGYQNEVISDINFLVEEIGEKPSRPWKFIGRLCDLLHLYPESSDTAKIASIAKSPAPGKDYIRIIVFVDDLDRCDDRVILKVLSAIHLVLAACNINVVLGMDQKMIARAMKLQFPDSTENVEELAMKYIGKIVQLSLALPDTSDDETKKFLHVQLGPTFEESQPTASEESQTNQDSTQDNGLPSGEDPDHVSVDICHDFPRKCQNILSKHCRIFKPSQNCVMRGSEEARENSNNNKKKKLKTMSLNFQMIMPNYTPAEREALDKLSREATGAQRLPREWKRFLIYHRVAWHILSQSEQVKQIPGWQMQLVVWVFCCWQWKPQIDLIIKSWKKLLLANYFGENCNDGLVLTKPSLKSIAESCYQTIWLPLHPNMQKHDEDEEMQQEEEPTKEVKEEAEDWESLKSTLDAYTYDVSMDGIISFQKFRLHCEIGHLDSSTNYLTM